MNRRQQNYLSMPELSGSGLSGSGSSGSGSKSGKSSGRNRLRTMVLSGLLIAPLVLAGCSYHGAAFIQSQPSGAEVVNVDDDTVLGVTPFKVWWREDSQDKKRINVRLQKEGFRDKVTSFWVTLRHSSKSEALGEPQHVEVTLDQNK